ncbi:hypothetical protein GGR53DRAFT_471748 [Hypoxylon sp. FL1150]|nr:hypothetical protein GGR53DRAFT_471748 [Hypoxylon sp. FL1150]
MRHLNIKYLCIDCLCIIHDDPDDWDREAAVTSQVYRDSITAVASKDSYSGCFPKRDSNSYVSPATISLGYASPREAMGPPSHSIIYYSPQKMEMGTLGTHFDPVADEPLSTRAWTL